MYKQCVCVILVIFLFSCKKERDDYNLHYEYFPVDIGSWVIYKVDSIDYNDFTGNVDTFRFYIKEIIESHFPDNEGRLTLRIERYVKYENDTAWDIKNVWKANRLNQRAEKVEENVRFIKMVFPILHNKTWDGNAFNFLNPQEYSYGAIHQPHTLNGFTFDSTVTVLQGKEMTLFTEKEAYEVYAKHIGCIYMKRKVLNKMANGTIISGYDYVYEALEWGN